MEWRRARDAGALAGLEPKVRRSKRSAEQAEIERLRRRNERLEDQLAKHRQALEIQGKSIGALAGAAGRGHRGDEPAARQVTAVTESCFSAAGPLLGTKAACAAVGRSRATHYRRASPARVIPRMGRPAPANKLPGAEASQVLAVLRSPRFADSSPAQVYFTLLDEGIYLASESSFYRILRAAGEVRERRRQATHPAKKKPELMAAKPLVVWSWDITRLKGPQRGDYYDCYVVLDIFSRYVVALCVAPSESGELARELIADAIARHQVPPGQLTIHADRGSSMTSNPVTGLYTFPGIRRSHSRPHVSNDNCYSEAQFKTLKYCPAFPGRFGSIQDARAFCKAFFN